MKILLLAFTALLFVNSAFSEDLGKQHEQWLLRIINDVRRNYANRYNISNMHELEFDIALCALSASAVRHCSPMEEAKNYYKQFNQYEIIFAKWAWRDENGLRTLATSNFLNPAQTKFGSSGDDGHRACRDINSGYTTVFSLGPEHERIVKYGAPGSQCNVGSVNKVGLCVKKA